jgi:molybdopterin/thiamine biosynthesis adenylyltransferase
MKELIRFFSYYNLVLDARVLVDIAILIDERTRALQIPWSWCDFKGYTWTNKAFKKRTGMNQQSVNS